MPAPRCPECNAVLGGVIDCHQDRDRDGWVRVRRCPNCGARVACWGRDDIVFPPDRQAEEMARLNRLRCSSRRARTRNCETVDILHQGREAG
jgi:hypothetical protein